MSAQRWRGWGRALASTVLVVGSVANGVWAQGGSAAPVRRAWTDAEVLSRPINPGREHQIAPWPAHRIIGNVYYVGTRNLGAFLVTTPAGHILVNTTWEETLPLIQKSVESLGFAWREIRIILGSHAHPDHMEGDALAKEQTGAEVMAMAEDVPLLVQIRPGGKPHPIDRVLQDGNTVELGNIKLTAHLAPGHTPGTTTWTLEAEEGGRTYHVVILGGATPTPRMDVTQRAIQKQFQRAFVRQRGLQCDVPLGPHVPMYEMEAKFARIRTGGPNPFVDPAGCQDELALSERTFYLLLRDQLAKAYR